LSKVLSSELNLEEQALSSELSSELNLEEWELALALK
tara:strand:+ start:214 stop:324 length:111 start_codon:yes stop_codon:yes gene_type:complete